MMKHLYSIHDFSPEWASIVKNQGKTGWSVISESIGDDPQNKSGKNYSDLFNFNIMPIVRLNFSHHGEGTIPLPNRYQEFAQRCANFVSASAGCVHWIIANEPNLAGERFNGIPITPEQYIDCYKKCRAAIKQREIQHKVLVAAVAPYNVDTGSWIDYWIKMLSALSVSDSDGFALHTYSRGGNPASITSEDKMNPPYQAYYNGFRAYRDFLAEIPYSMQQLPVYITETDQNIKWEDSNSGWVKAAYKEIDDWNKNSNNQKIFCLTLYRWENFDQWGIKGKNGVIQDFSGAVSQDFQAPSANKILLPKLIAPQPIPTPTGTEIVPIGTPKATVKAVLLNVRDKPGVAGSNIVGSRSQGDKIFILEERTVDGNVWYRIGAGQWVIAEWLDRAGAPSQNKWERSRAFTAGWEGGFQNLHWDIGNWTGGAVGVGENKGTNFGITAASYPHLDIKNITREIADQIYFQDYWLKSGASELAWPFCLLVFDTAINFGANTAAIWLNQSGGNPYYYIALRLRGYRKSKSWPQAGNAWVDRTVDLLLEASE